MARTVPSADWVESLLNDLELLDNDLNSWYGRFQDENNRQNEEVNPDEIKFLKLDLRFMKTFVRCARKWMREYKVKEDAGDGMDFIVGYEHDSSPKSMVDFWPSINPIYFSVPSLSSRVVNPVDFCPSTTLDSAVSHFGSEIKLFQGKINRLYIPSFYSSCSSPSSLHGRDELMENIDLLVENLMDLLRWGKTYSQDLKEQIEVLEENLKFLKILISFATLQGVEFNQLQDLLTHTEVMAVNTARLCYVYWFNRDDEIVCNGMQHKISQLLEKIKPIDPQVNEIYIQVLTATKSSGSLQELTLESDKHIVRNFIDSLLGSLWELLNCSGSFMTSVKVQMKRLYKELRFLRSILKEEKWEKLHKIREKIKDPIADVVIEAGIVVCSLFVNPVKEDLVKQMDAALSDLLEKLKLIKVEVTEKDPVTSAFHFPGTDGLCFIDFSIENLKELEGYGDDLIGFAKDQIQILREDLVYLRSFLEKIVEQRNQHEKLQALWDHVIEVAYKVDCAIRSLTVQDIPDCCLSSLDAITEEIKLIKTETLEIYDTKKHDREVHKVMKISNYLPSQGRILSSNEVVVGFDDEAQKIIDKLTRGSNQLGSVSILGMPGIGKTTLARKVYSDKSIVCHFHQRAWCFVTQSYCKQNLLLDILDCIVSKLPEHCFKMDEDDLADELRKCLMHNRYLIVLDDVWDIGAAWNDLEGSFPNDVNGSRILFTSRIHKVASLVKPNSEPHFLRTLTDDESKLLLQEKLFAQKPCSQTLSELLLEIAKRCKGLPMTVVIVAGILATIEQDDWGKVAKSLSLDIVSGTKQCMNTLELSYKHLPHYLKPCLLYFGAFPKGREIPAWKMMTLWIAEGFVPKNELKNLELEEVAENYIMDLIGRSLVMVSERRSTDEVKACRIHDLLHEFCVAKTKEENFQQFLHGYDELSTFDEPCNLRRLCIYSEPEHFVKSRLFCPHARCLQFFADHNGLSQNRYNISFIFRFFRQLMVLDISEINVGDSFPRETELLVWLRYLAVKGKMKSIPSSIAKLSNLETFVVVGLYDNISLPTTLWNMKKLRHLRMVGCSFAFLLPNDNLESSSCLCNLYTLSTAFVSFEQSVSLEKVFRKFPYIQKLKCILRCRIREFIGDGNNIVPFGFLSRLKSFNVSFVGASRYPFEIGFPLNLKKLTLSNYCQPWSKISTIGKLPNLEVLKLLNKAFEGEVWDMKEGEFLKLRVLKLESLGIVRWRGSDDNLPCLQKLVLQSCGLLEEVPSCLKDSSTLEMIELRFCHSSVVSLVRHIEQEQVDMGNEFFKILINMSSLC